MIHNKQNIIIILITLFGIVFTVNSQDFIWNDITAKHQISSDIAETMLETRDGFIWIGTIRSGLWFFDGYELKKISKDGK